MLTAGAHKTIGGKLHATTTALPVPTRITLSTTALDQGGTLAGAWRGRIS